MPDAPDNIVPINKNAQRAARKFSEEHGRELLTILFTDLVDSTRLQTDLGNVEAARITEVHREIVRDELDKYDAREIEWAGDSCLAVFTKPSDAVVFALRMQAEHRRVRETEKKLPTVRVGMHLGEIVVKKRNDGGKKSEDLFGLQVSEAARVMSVARGNQVYCTRAVFDNARSALKGQKIDGVGDAIWVHYGAYLLKGSEEPVELCEIGAADVSVMKAPEANDKVAPVMPGGVEAMRELISYEHKAEAGGVSRWLGLVVGVILAIGGISAGFWMNGDSEANRGSVAESWHMITSLAVLPLDNLMNDPTEDYFVDGMTEAITGELSKISSLKVISRTSTVRYKDTMLTLPQIAEELGVQGIIEGSVLRDGDDVTIRVRLFDGPTENQLWNDDYTKPVTSVLKLHAEVALDIANEIRATVEPDERQRITEKDEVDPAALEAYLLGRESLESRESEDIYRAIEEFERAVRIDDGFALAYAGLADAYFLLGEYEFATETESYEKSIANARAAISLDDSLAEPYAAMGATLLKGRAWSESRAAHLDALSLDPNYAQGHHWYALYLRLTGRNAEAETFLKKALALDPRSKIVKKNIAWQGAYEGDYLSSARELEALLAEEPDFQPTIIAYHYTLSALGRSTEALEIAQSLAALRNNDAFSTDHVAATLVDLGRTAEAKSMVDAHPAVDTEDWMWYHASSGNIEEVLSALRNGAADPTSMMRLLSSPRFEALRGDDRFWEFLDEIDYPIVSPDHPIYSEQQAYLTRKAAKELLAEQGLDGSPRVDSLAVLPFENVSGEVEKEYFVDGMTGALTSELSKISSIKVIGRASAMHYKDTDKSPREIAEELDVDALITGTALQVNNEVRITAELMYAATQTTLWTNHYDDAMENVLKLHSNVALDIAEEIQAALNPETEERYAAAEGVNPEAYNAYLLGLSLMEDGSEQGLRRAIDQFTLATELDPEFSPFFTGLARAYWELGVWNFMPPKEASDIAYNHATHAVELNEYDALAHGMLGSLHGFRDWNWSASETALRRAIELEPNVPNLRLSYAELLFHLGRDREATREMETVIELDPSNLRSMVSIGFHHYAYGRHDEAVKHFETVLQENPEHPSALEGMALALRERGEWDESLSYNEREIAMRGRDSDVLARMAATYVRMGATEQASELLEEALELAEFGPHSPSYMAMLFVDLNDFESVFAWIERGLEQKEDVIPALRTGRIKLLARLREEPRFWALMDRVGLPPLPPGHPAYETEQAYLINKRAEELIAERGLVPAGE